MRDASIDSTWATMNPLKGHSSWSRRFEHLGKAFQLLERSLAITPTTDMDELAIIKSYEMAFELSWKLMKDYLAEEGVIATTPRDAIKGAYAAELIQDGEQWLKALKDRNLTAHTYNEEVAEEVIASIRAIYFPMLRQFRDEMAREAGR